jgi:predicted DNA-binding ribbon-helix-helix protein
MSTINPRYDQDVYGWATHTAELLRSNKMDEVDFENIIEEIESLGRSEKNGLTSSLRLIISHLLKWQYQPERRTPSWKGTISTHRMQAEFYLEDNPSLKSKIDDILVKAYKRAVIEAANDTLMEDSVFPKECPYSFEEITSNEFYPEAK